MSNLLRSKLRIEEKNHQLLEKIRCLSAPVPVAPRHVNAAGGEARRSDFQINTGQPRRASKLDSISTMTAQFEIRCLERLYVFLKLAADNCFTGYPVAASLLARGVMETAGLLILFETKLAKLPSGNSKEKGKLLRKFAFGSRKFGADKKAVHVLDCVRVLKPYYIDAEDLYELLCESVHPNWLGVSRFKEFAQEGDELTEFDEFMYTTIFQALLLGHKVAGTVDLLKQRETHDRYEEVGNVVGGKVESC